MSSVTVAEASVRRAIVDDGFRRHDQLMKLIQGLQLARNWIATDSGCLDKADKFLDVISCELVENVERILLTSDFDHPLPEGVEVNG